MKQRLLLVFAMIAILVGCSYKIEVIVDGSTPFFPIFSLVKPIAAPPVGKSVQLNSFSIYKKNGNEWDYHNPVWSFYIEPGSSKDISKIEYGQVPQGFKLGVACKKLIANTPYLVVAIGAGGRGGVGFVIVEESGFYTIKAINPQVR